MTNFIAIYGFATKDFSDAVNLYNYLTVCTFSIPFNGLELQRISLLAILDSVAKSVQWHGHTIFLNEYNFYLTKNRPSPHCWSPGCSRQYRPQ